MNRYSLGFENGVRIGDDIWFSESNYNGLYRYNLKEKIAERIADFPNEDMMQASLYVTVRLYKRSLIFVPCTAKAVSIYNIETNSFKQIEIPHLESPNGYEPDYYEGIVYNDMLYIIGCGNPVIIKINLKNFEVKVVYKICNDQDEPKGRYFGTQVAVEGNLLYIPCCDRNAVLEFDMDHDTGLIIRIGDGINKYIRIVKDHENFYLVTKDTNHIVYWNKSNNTSVVIETEFRKKYCDALIRISEKYIWMISIISGEVYRIHKPDHMMWYIDLKREVEIECSALYLDGICFLDYSTRNWYYLNEYGAVTDLETKILEPRSAEEVWAGFNQTFCTYYTENLKTPISYYIYRILSGEEDKRKVSAGEASIGEMIWHSLSTEERQ